MDVPLTEAGAEMARCFAESYLAVPWRAIYTSTMTRAVRTAQALATRAALLIHREPRLDEIHYGAWQGLSKPEVERADRARYRQWCEDPTVGPPGGESVLDVRARALALIDEIQARHREGEVLLVSHKTTLRVLVCSLLGIELARYRDRIAQPVCGLSVIELGARGPRLRTLGDVGHLPPALRARALGEPLPARAPASAEASRHEPAVAAVSAPAGGDLPVV
jgi:probable phosphoglycerate mutase